jgi:dihydroceramide fatty acyl 2-hydroxylase
MFESDFLEWFSHVHPATPAVLFLPLVGYAVYAALSVHHQPLPRVAVLLAAGYLAWTLFEYWAHRLFFHMKVRGPWTRRVYFFFHGVHHEYAWDTTRLVMPPAVSLVLAVIIHHAFRALFGAAAMWAPFAGFVLGYVIYDSVHWYAHAGKPTTKLGRWVRREHMMHHFKDTASRFGVSCPWLDHVFRTTGARADRGLSRTDGAIPSS